MKRLLLYSTLMLTTACAKKDTEPTIDFGPNGGFTMRDASNYPSSQKDPTDWTSDASWNDAEQHLFSNLNLSLTGQQLSANTWEMSSYPNACSLAGGCAFIIRRGSNNAAVPSGTIRVNFVIVDAHYKPLSSSFDYDYSTFNGAALKFDPSKFAANNLYRLYYVIYSFNQQVYYRGHGDIKVE